MVAKSVLERMRSPAEVRVTVPAPPAEVFAVLTDPQDHPGWNGGDVVVSEPPNRLLVEVHAWLLTGEAEFELERTSSGTLVTFRERITGAFAPTMPLLRGPIFLRNRSVLDKLRQRFEPLVVKL